MLVGWQGQRITRGVLIAFACSQQIWVGKVSLGITTRKALHFFFLNGFSTRHPEHFGGGDLHRKQTFPLAARTRGLELSVRFLPPREVVQSPPPPQRTGAKTLCRWLAKQAWLASFSECRKAHLEEQVPYVFNELPLPCRTLRGRGWVSFSSADPQPTPFFLCRAVRWEGEKEQEAQMERI